ncbi:polysaccharide pyruvyl transferase family protein [Sporosarcina sp. FSL K6-1522]|uniref:polysaccharide pyruvyl transferase family protein n=1 Tax=Sporosarcina sp. FSL K6-1522 TaxID=2921554 RepID=UPI00315A3E85
MYTLLYGAKKNVGDYLILDRAVKLLEKHRPDRKLNLVKRWLPIDEHLEQINKSKAVILCGGPAYQKEFYPGIYPLTKELADIKVPIIPFGLGWFSEYADQDWTDFNFSNSSYLMIDRIHRTIPLSSTRDYYTESILKNHGFNNTIMTGCPAWYELDHIQDQFKPANEIKKVVVTTAQDVQFHEQNIDLLHRVSEMFPDAEKYCVFHRGILNDPETSISEENNLLKIKSAADALNYQVVDASYDVKKIDFYKQCDIHFGYRVHAHIYFLSIRKPSFLLHEDGRGRGFSEAMNLTCDLPAYKSNILDDFMDRVSADLENNFSSFIGLEKVFQTYYKNMESFIKTLP